MMIMEYLNCRLFRLFISLWIFVFVEANRNNDAVLLEDIEVLTLRNGLKTTARRTSPIPQLQCVGGTAGCGVFVPETVQCYNRGSDGIDVQWECKTDMDRDFRFGRVEVVCEGYKNADDPYVLKGSCGLEYTIDLTKEGASRYPKHQRKYEEPMQEGLKTPKWVSWLFVGGLVWFAYMLYRTCIAQQHQRQPQFSSTSSDYPQGPGHDNRGGSDWSAPRGPPPPYPGDSSAFPGESCGNTNQQQRNAGWRPGFWSGLGAGAAATYLFGGNRNQGYYQRQAPYNPNYGGGGFFGSGSSYTSAGSSSGGGSSSSRETSGFGGTRRR